MNINQMTQQLQPNFLTDMTSLESAYRLATAFHKANCFNSTVQNTEQALILLMAGNEAGLKPVESMNSFYFVNNKLNMFGSGLAKAISRAGIKIVYDELSKQEIKVKYIKDSEVIQELNYKITDLPTNSKAKSFAPEEKLVYHAHSRFLRYNDVGVSIPYTDYDQEVIENNKTTIPKVSHSAKNKVVETATAAEFVEAAEEKPQEEKEAPTEPNPFEITVEEVAKL